MAAEWVENHPHGGQGKESQEAISFKLLPQTILGWPFSINVLALRPKRAAASKVAEKRSYDEHTTHN